jgi:hypothetical protein
MIDIKNTMFLAVSFCVGTLRACLFEVSDKTEPEYCYERENLLDLE